MRQLCGVTVVVALCWTSAPASADVRIEQRLTYKGEGMMAGITALPALKNPVAYVAVKGHRKMTRSGPTGELIDLRQEKVYEIDFARRTYTVKTFEQLRREASDKARALSQRTREDEVRIELRESGDTRRLSGYEAREIVMTISIAPKGVTLQQGGGLVLSASIWVASAASLAELEDFDSTYEEQAKGSIASSVVAAVTAASNPMFAEVIKAAAAIDAKGAALAWSATSSMIAPLPKPGEPAIEGGVLHIEQELVRVSQTVSEADVSVPAGFTEVMKTASPSPVSPAPGMPPPPKRTKHVAPVYPPDAQQARVQGNVVVEAVIGVDGKVVATRIVQSIPMLDAAAIEAVKQWEYEPTIFEGKPVSVFMTVNVTFSLK
jgi:TonB family protein